ncbi:MAG: elongation factor 4 [Candidatus Moranbacteria bacterium RIFCSPHIGHO2_02_FULL_40_12b]|nr:MAG: elongation factor 4 [Candidatus Moranbacteria bacterium RIFCSPHIGHO2_02_FULL_40_12b]OGI23507.1 MAG: elongation factor 4 [Candidatus Moranbacteria bacterium RIFCSPHIGHO2_12_FULL_40_10]
MNQSNTRNFCIIAHIDHGKSTLADRMLEITGTIEKRKMKEQVLDQMDLERERGITIKLQPVRMEYEPKISNEFKIENLKLKISSSKFILNLIDTPGHVDFNYEVSRSLAAVEGAVLLVDATKGVQAQTLSNLYLAIEQGLEIIPVVNKIDLPNANAEKTKKEIVHILGCKKEDIMEVSGKTGQGVENLLERIIKIIPCPQGENKENLRALIFDSKYDTYKGVLAYVRIVDGEVKAEDKIFMIVGNASSDVIEVGYFKPELQKCEKLSAGDIGYIATGLKSVSQCRVGDTITIQNEKLKVKNLRGYKEVKPMVYASFYPIEGDDYNFMRDSLEKLKLNDAAFTFEPESNQALGRGFRCGFLGMLHLEIIQSRLEREFEISPTITTPSVVYELRIKNQESKIKIYSPSEMPDPSIIEEIYEPCVKLDIISPSAYLGPIMKVMKNTRAEYFNTEYIDSERLILTFSCPLTDVIINLHDDLKSASSGYGSMNYEITEYKPYDLVKMDILVAGEKVDAFSRIIPREWAFSEGKRVVEKLKGAIPKQNFQIALQAAVGGKIIARETIKAFRKDVTEKLYGGDVSRKKKLLEKQKKGKKKMKNIGRVSIPSEAFLAVLKK